MSKENTPRPLGEYAIQQFETILPLLRTLGLSDKNICKNFEAAEQHLERIKLIMANRDLFAKIYSPLGWVNYDRLSTEVVATVVNVSLEEGESTLTEYHLDSSNLSLLAHRFKMRTFESWCALYERAVERADAKDYLSAIPVVLCIIDGICTTLSGKHPFSGGADAPVFDSQTSGPGGLSEGLALLGSTRRKLDTNPIPAPFRHGIVHGLNPNYGSPIVAAKAFNLLQATVDYFDRRSDEEYRLIKAENDQKPIDLRELGERLRKNADVKRASEEWRPRPTLSDVALASSDAPSNLPADSPEAFAAEYLTLLSVSNYGRLAAATVDYPKRTIGYRAGRIREDLKVISVTRWTITGIEDTTSAMSRVMTRLEGKLNGQPWSGDHPMQLLFADADYESVVRGQAGGTWNVMPDFLAGLWLKAIEPKQRAHGK